MMADDDKPAMEPGKLSRHWQTRLELASKDHKDFMDNGKAVVDRYKSGQGKKASTARKFNILYSNTEVIRAALYSKAAKPDVRRRWADRNPVARQAAEVVERALIYCADVYSIDEPVKAAVKEMLLPGRGVCRIVYEPVLTQAPIMAVDSMTGMEMPTEEMQDVIADQRLYIEHVYWEDFICEPERNWEKVSWIAFRHTKDGEGIEELYESKPEGSKTYGKPEDVPRNWQPEMPDGKPVSDDLKKAEVWEIWCKKSRKVYWIVKGCSFALRVDPDPYQLERFFPVPQPPVFYSTTDSIIPEPEFFAYKDQADDLDEITTRISRLTRALKRRGVYDKSIQELKRLSTAQDNEFIGVDNYQALAQKGGLAAAFQNEDIAVIAQVLMELYKQREQLMQTIYEVTGISDIVRGSSKASETATAQQLKSQFGSLRLKERLQMVSRWLRDMYQIKAEIISEHFEPDVLSRMTGQQVPPEVIEILRDDKMRGYSINVETDMTIFEDSEQEKKSRIEVVTAIGQYLTQAVPMGQAMPPLVPVMFDVLSFMVRGFKAGRELEDKIDQAQQQVMDMMQKQAQQPPKPDPEMEKAKMEMEFAQQEHQMDMQGKQLDAQVHQAKAQTDMQKIAMQAQAAMQQAMQPPMEPVQ